MKHSATSSWAPSTRLVPKILSSLAQHRTGRARSSNSSNSSSNSSSIAEPPDEIDEEEQLDAALQEAAEGPRWTSQEWIRTLLGELGPSWGVASVVPPAGEVTHEYVLAVLETITFPPCLSRNNVQPDGAMFINAFPMSRILNYQLGLMCSTTLKIWPNLAKLLTAYIRQHSPMGPAVRDPGLAPALALQELLPPRDLHFHVRANAGRSIHSLHHFDQRLNKSTGNTLLTSCRDSANCTRSTTV